MIEAGVDVFRINFSHADYEDVRERVNMIREINDEMDTNIAILGDLQGPKLKGWGHGWRSGCCSR